MRNSVRRKLHLERGKVLHHQRRQVPILPKRKQILLVKGIDVGFGVFVDYDGRDDDGSAFVGCSNTVHGKAAGKTGDGSKERFERFGQVMRDKVFVYLHVSWRRDARCGWRTWIMVVRDSRSLASLVSPQIPMIVESSEVHAISRLSESGMTVCCVNTNSMIPKCVLSPV